MPDDNKPKKAFKVTISDEDYLSPDELDEKLKENVDKKPNEPSVPNSNGTYNRPKFEVHIDEDDDLLEFKPDDSNPEYKGEIYFSGRKPVRSAPVSLSAGQQNRSGQGSVKKKRNARSAFSLFLAIVVILGTGCSAFGISCVNDVLAFGRSEDTVTVTIPLDATTDQIVDILSDAGLVKQEIFCRIYCNLINKALDKKTDYKSGVYDVSKNLGVEGYLTKFREVQTGQETVMVSIPEGWSIYQIFDRLDKFGVCDKKKLISSITGTAFEYDFVNEIANDPNRTFKLEGYLYPNTYEFYVDSDANSVIRKLLDEFDTEWTDKYQKRADELGMTKDEIITIASIIQREAADSTQMADISSVIHNRLKHSASWPTLNCDSTENYINTYVSPEVTEAKAVLYKTQYDTYSIQGLPPGPICNPGGDAINAALYPNDTNYYFFRHDNSGKIYLASTQSEHDANANAVLRANNN